MLCTCSRPTQPSSSSRFYKKSQLLFMIMRQAIRRDGPLRTLLRCAFSTPFFGRTSAAGERVERVQTRAVKSEDEAKEALAALVNKINDANKYFLGVKLNTNYLKVNKELTYEDAIKLTAEKSSANDIPIEFSKKDADMQAFEKCNQEDALRQKSGQVAFARGRLEPTLQEMRRLLQHFMISVGRKSRMIQVEPNFQLQCIKTFNSLDSKLTFQLTQEDVLPEIKIKSITLLRGLTAYRNDNYSTDSYEKDETELADGILTYRLYKQLKQDYPEPEWFSTKRINARFEILIRGGPALTLLDSGASLGSTGTLTHSAVFETDLLPPPPNAEHLLSADDFLRSYRLDSKSLLLTNFDRKNQYYPLTYTEEEKKTVLVNRIL